MIASYLYKGFLIEKTDKAQYTIYNYQTVLDKTTSMKKVKAIINLFIENEAR